MGYSRMVSVDDIGRAWIVHSYRYFHLIVDEMQGTPYTQAWLARCTWGPYTNAALTKVPAPFLEEKESRQSHSNGTGETRRGDYQETADERPTKLQASMVTLRVACRLVA